MNATRHFQARLARQAGFTIVEMMVAMAISFVVMLGFAVTFVNIKGTFLAQDKVAQLQDNERLAMAILTQSAQEAGYFPFPTGSAGSSQIVSTTDTTYGNMAAGDVVFGNTVGTSDTVSLAFAASADDGLITCQGHTITAADVAGVPSPANNSVGVRHIFYVDTAAKTLNCIVKINNNTTASYGGGTQQPLVTNVVSMQALYGVDPGGTGSITGYRVAGDVANWSQVKAVRLTLNFVNPNDTTSTIPWTQTINLLNR